MKNLIILQKIEDLIESSNPYLVKFPKAQRFILASRIEATIDSLFKQAISLQRKFYKKNTLQEMIINLDALRGYIRRSYKLKFISAQNYGVWVGYVVEISNMVWSYYKYTQEKGRVDLPEKQQ